MEATRVGTQASEPTGGGTLLAIRGMLAEGTAFDPDRVADAYADLVAQTDGARGTWQSTRTYDG